MLTTQIIKAFSIILLGIMVMGCSTSQPKNFNTNALTLTTTEMKHRSLLMESYDNWKGVPYLYGGQTHKGIDCSALVQTFFKRNFAYGLPRTTTKQSKVGHSCLLYTFRAHETPEHLVCRLLLEKKQSNQPNENKS